MSRAWATLRADGALLLSLLGVVSCLSIFAWVADEVTDQHTQSFDEQLIRQLRDPVRPAEPRGPDWLLGAMRDFTALGSAVVLALFVLAVAGALLARRQYHALLLLLAAAFGGMLLNIFLKPVFARPRPDLALRLTEVRTLSFPSGHAMGSAIVYMTLAALLARMVQPRALKLYFVGLAALLTFLVGTSRVYLGVHYPTDVLAGWTVGLAWALLCWTVARHLQRRGSVEPEK
ncbi:MAG: phosphatase PAP2 family protein [Solirubrobacterales bacterium]